MGLFSRLAGVVGNFFQIGGPTGPGVNRNGAALEVKDSTNTTFAVLRAADPVAANDTVNLEYLQNHALLQGGNTFTPSAALQAGQNDVTKTASFAVPATGVSLAQLLLDPNGGAPIASLDVEAGVGGVVNVGAGAGAKSVFVGNVDPGTVTDVIGWGGITVSSGPGPLTLGTLTQDHTTVMGGNTGVSVTAVRAGTGGINAIAPKFNLSAWPSAAPTQVQTLQFEDLANTNWVGFKAPNVIPANVTWQLPAADATSPGQVLTSNAAGVLSWANPGTPSGGLESIRFAIGTATVSSATSLPAGAVVSRCTVEIDVSYGAGTISVGQTGVGNASLFQAVGDNFPTAAPNSYDAPQTTPAASANPVLVTITGGTLGSGFVYIEYSVPQG